MAIFDRDGAGRNKYDSLKNKKYKYINLKCEYIKRYDGETFNEVELEDFIYPELIFDAVNKFLRKQKYKQVKKADRQKRTLPAYNKKPVLDFITEVCRSNNEDKNGIDFNSLAMKLFLSKTICNEIENIDLETHNVEFPKVREYLEQIAKH